MYICMYIFCINVYMYDRLFVCQCACMHICSLCMSVYMYICMTSYVSVGV